MKYKTIFDESKYGKLDLAIAVELTKEYVKLTYNDTKEITIFGYPALDMDCTECYGFGYLDKQKNAIETEPQPNLGDLVAVSDESSKEELNWLLRVGSYWTEVLHSIDMDMWDEFEFNINKKFISRVYEHFGTIEGIIDFAIEKQTAFDIIDSVDEIPEEQVRALNPYQQARFIEYPEAERKETDFEFITRLFYNICDFYDNEWLFEAMKTEKELLLMKHAYEYTIRQDILYFFEETNALDRLLPFGREYDAAKMLLLKKDPVKWLYNQWFDSENSSMEALESTLRNCCTYELQ